MLSARDYTNKTLEGDGTVTQQPDGPTRSPVRQGDLTAADYRNALESQQACNLSGIVHTFSEAISRIWNEAHVLGHGTDWVNEHPICVLYTAQIMWLNHKKVYEDSVKYSEATDWCQGKLAYLLEADAKKEQEREEQAAKPTIRPLHHSSEVSGIDALTGERRAVGAGESVDEAGKIVPARTY